MPTSETKALQQVAYDELNANGGFPANPFTLAKPGSPERCSAH